MGWTDLKHWIAGYLLVLAGTICCVGIQLATIPFALVLGAIFGGLLGLPLAGCVLVIAIVIKKLFRIESHAKVVYGVSGLACASLVLIATINNTPRKRLDHYVPNAPEHAEVLCISGRFAMEVLWAVRFHAPAPEIHRMIERNHWEFLEEVDEPDKHFVFLFSLVKAEYENPGRCKCYAGKTGAYNYKAYVNSAEDLVLLVFGG